MTEIRIVETVRHVPKYTKKEHGQGNQVLLSMTAVSISLSTSAPYLIGFTGIQWFVMALFGFGVLQFFLTLYVIHEMREIREQMQAIETKTERTEPAPAQQLVIRDKRGEYTIPAKRDDLVLSNGYKLSGRQVDWLKGYALDNDALSSEKLTKSNFWTTGNESDRRGWYLQMRDGMAENDPPLVIKKGNSYKFTDNFRRL